VWAKVKGTDVFSLSVSCCHHIRDIQISLHVPFSAYLIDGSKAIPVTGRGDLYGL
jgi:hypothetical protein